MVPADPDDRERMAFAVRHPRRVDIATVGALAEVLAATRRVEDRIWSAGVLPSVQAHRGLAASLLADARGPVRDRLGSLTGELHQYLGWLLAERDTWIRLRSSSTRLSRSGWSSMIRT